MKTAITGASGFIGGAVSSALEAGEHEVFRLVRRTPQNDGEIYWNPTGAEESSGGIDSANLEGMDAVFHFAAENIAGKWTPEKMRRIRDSRISGTRLLAGALAGLESPPRVLIAASGIGYYGDTGDIETDEDGKLGGDFLALLCRDWEAACEPARAAGIRVFNLRIGVVLDKSSGALKGLLPVFKMGLGGRLGGGGQWWSCISLRDLVRAAIFAMDCDALSGPVNAAAPNPVTNAEFTRALARALNRPAVFAVPKFALRAALGKMAEGALASQRVVPRKLLDAGFTFNHPDIDSMLKSALSDSK